MPFNITIARSIEPTDKVHIAVMDIIGNVLLNSGKMLVNKMGRVEDVAGGEGVVVLLMVVVEHFIMFASSDAAFFR